MEGEKPNWSRLGRSSRNRGCDFERDVCKRINLLLGEKFKFHRTPTSGGHAIKGDLYEDPNLRTEWSNLEIYCRTQRDISFEAMLCDFEPLPSRWMKETGINSVWIFRSRPGRVFMMIHAVRIRVLPKDIPALRVGRTIVFSLDKLPHLVLNLGKM